MRSLLKFLAFSGLSSAAALTTAEVRSICDLLDPSLDDTSYEDEDICCSRRYVTHALHMLHIKHHRTVRSP